MKMLSWSNRESKPKVLPDNDPVLTEGSGDPVLHGVLVDGPKVDVGSGSPLLLVGKVVGCLATKTCFP